MLRFEFFALRFWEQWQRKEERLYQVLRTAPTEQDIREALNHFQVARTFKELRGEGRTAYIRDCLIRVRDDSTLPQPHEKVERLVDELSKNFGSSNISAASKLLWLSFRSPYVIYDRRAAETLREQFGARFQGYQQYAAAWRTAYKENERAIGKAVEELPKARLFMRSEPPQDLDIVSVAKEAWFKERVFDLYLWEIGV